MQALDLFGSTRLRYYHGLRVRFEATGSFGWIDPEELLMNMLNILTSAIVFVGVSKTLVYYAFRSVFRKV